MLRRRSFTTLALASLATPLFAQEKETEPLANTIGPYLQNPSDSGITVMLLTQGNGKMTVEYGAGQIEGSGTPVEGTPWFSWRARLHKLQAGQVLEYRVVWQPETGTGFTTPVHKTKWLNPADANCKFLVFNDVHNNTAVVKALMSHIDTREHDFTLLVGDIWTDPSPAKGAEKVFRTMQELVELLDAASKPILFVRGNHETRGGFKNRMAHLFDIPGLAADKAHDEQDWWFELRVGPLALIAADTGEDDYINTKQDSYKRPVFWQSYRQRQIPWLQGLAQNKEITQAPWRIFVSHIPLYNPAKWFCESATRDWPQHLDKLGLHLLLAGHDHSWKFVPEKLTFACEMADEDNAKYMQRFTPPWSTMIGGGPSIKGGTVMSITASKTTFQLEMFSGEGKFLRAYEMRV